VKSIYITLLTDFEEVDEVMSKLVRYGHAEHPTSH
jgi:hypothetical protein